MRRLHRVSSGSRSVIRPVLSRTRLLALASALTLPLTLNASGSIIATAAHDAPSPAAPDAVSLPAQDAIEAGPYDELPEISRSNREPRSVKVSSPKGTITWTASSLADHGLPSAAKRAYVNAAHAMTASDPSCQLPWTLLAGVGRVESDHGRYGGSVLGADGVSHPLVIGVPLNGAGPVAAIRDTDNGRLDQDKVWDRAVGPMQFIPSTWADAARDGDGDGVESPNDIDDAALAAAAYLCSGSGSVLGESAMSAAIFRYNASKDYVALVMAMEEGYRTGVFVMPTTVVPDKPAHHAKNKRHAQGHKHKDSRRHGSGKSSSPMSGGKPAGGTHTHAHPTGSTTTSGGGGGNGGGTSPSPSPSPTPSTQPKPPPKQPKPPKPETKSGTLARCGTEWCLNGAALDLGGPARLQATATSDYNGNNVAGETNEQELEGLSGLKVTVTLNYGTSTVIKIQGFPY